MAKVCMNLQKVREEKLLTQAELGKLANLTTATVYRAEKGRGMSLATVKSLAKALGVKPDRILFKDEED